MKRVIPSIVLLVLFFGVAGAKEKPAHFYFVQITDTHFGFGDSDSRIKAVVDSINELPMKIVCVVHTGDIVDDPRSFDKAIDTAMPYLRKLKYPLHVLPGNHDVSVDDLKGSAQRFRQRFGYLSSSATYQGVLFVFAYTEPINHSFIVEGYDPIGWLESVLRSAGDVPVLLFYHTPFVDEFENNTFKPSTSARGYARWKTLVDRYPVTATFAGHFHSDELHHTGRVPLFVAPPVSGKYGRQAAYRLYEYNNGTLSYRTQYIH